MPPKCIVRRERSVRQVQRVGLERKLRRVRSSAGVMKSGWRVRPGTRVVCILLGRDKSAERGGEGIMVLESFLDCLGRGAKKSDMALRFGGLASIRSTIRTLLGQLDECN